MVCQIKKRLGVKVDGNAILHHLSQHRFDLPLTL